MIFSRSFRPSGRNFIGTVFLITSFIFMYMMIPYTSAFYDSAEKIYRAEFDNGNGFLRVYIYLHGGTNTTNDILLGFQTTADGGIEAEGIKNMSVILYRNGVSILNYSGTVDYINKYIRTEHVVNNYDNLTLLGNVTCGFIIKSNNTVIYRQFRVDLSYIAPPPKWYEIGTPIYTAGVMITAGAAVFAAVYMIRHRTEIEEDSK